MKYIKKQVVKIRWWIIPLILACTIGNLWLSTYNTKLQYELQSKETLRDNLIKENQQLIDEINILKNKERIIGIASNNGLSQVIDNVIYLK